MLRFFGKSHISELDMALLVQEQILWLQVAKHNLLTWPLRIAPPIPVSHDAMGMTTPPKDMENKQVLQAAMQMIESNHHASHIELGMAFLAKEALLMVSGLVAKGTASV